MIEFGCFLVKESEEKEWGIDTAPIIQSPNLSPTEPFEQLNVIGVFDFSLSPYLTFCLTPFLHNKWHGKNLDELREQITTMSMTELKKEDYLFVRECGIKQQRWQLLTICPQMREIKTKEVKEFKK